MNTPIVDYISISVPTPKLMTQFHLSLPGDFAFHPDDRTARIIDLILNAGRWNDYGGFKVFDTHVRYEDFGFSYFEGNKSNVSLIQFSGQGCETLRQMGILEEILNDWHDRLTRIDVALDIEGDVDLDILRQAYTNRRFKDGGYEPSQNGITYYVGSRRSSRFARIYRYNEPHPRAGVARLEMQSNDEHAKQVGAMVADMGVTEAYKMLHSIYGWTHPDTILCGEPVPAYKITRPDTFGSKERWLIKQVLPALKKLAAQGKTQFLGEFAAEIHAIIQEIEIEREAYA